MHVAVLVELPVKVRAMRKAIIMASEPDDTNRSFSADGTNSLTRLPHFTSSSEDALR